MRARRIVTAAKDGILTAFAFFLGIAIVFPIIYCVAAAFKTRPELSAFPPSVFPESFLYLDNFAGVFSMVPLTRFMLNSLIVSALGSSLRISFAVLAAYSFAHFEFRFKGGLFMFVLGTMMLPADTLVVTNYLSVARLNLLDNYLGICVTSLTGASQMFMLRQFFKTLPRSFRDSAFVDGCGDIRYLVSIAVPISSPVIFTLMAQSFINFWNAYLWPLLVTNKIEMRTAQIGVAMLTNPLDTNYTLVLAAVSVLFIPSFALFILLRRVLAGGITPGALIG